RYLVFRWRVEIIREIPATHVGRGIVWIKQFDGISRIGVGVGEHLIDVDGGNGGSAWVNAAGGAVERPARTPTGRQTPRIESGLVIDDLQREPEAIGDGEPFIAVTEVEDRFP